MNDTQKHALAQTGDDTVTSGSTSFSPAAPKDRKRVLEKMLQAAGRIRFLEILGGEWNGDTTQMACVRLRFRLPATRLDALQSDLRAAWQSDIAVGGTGVCRTVDTANGIEFRFAVMQGETYVTGVFFVELAEELSAA